MSVTFSPPQSTMLPPPDPLGLRDELAAQFHACGLIRPFRRSRYEPGERLSYAVTGVFPAHAGRVVLDVEKFVGGGFAGQVYRVRLLELESEGESPDGLRIGSAYAIKILKPPSGLGARFRDFLYFLAYQGAFGAQTLPAAVRTGVLWQKLIRRAAARRFGRPDAVCDTFATFYDDNFHSFGEINEWVDGRIWKFEVDDCMFERWNFDGEPPADAASPEYICKKLFMDELVGLLHEMGAPELARQYEWWTTKSQPNALKRLSYDHSPRDGVTAIDFRAGLALLPVLPMSPADFRLIGRGLLRGRIVQFDRSDPERFERFLADHQEDFEDLSPAIEELKRQEAEYRKSLPDVTHHHVRLLTDSGLRKQIKEGTITAWRNLGRIDDEHAERMRARRGLFALLYAVAWLPLLGRLIVKLWGNATARAHWGHCLSSFGYLWRAMRGARIEILIVWHRAGRVSDERALKLVHRPVRYWIQRILLGWAPPTWHRACCEPRWGWRRVREKVGFVLKFLRVAPFREEWLLEQIRLGRAEGMLTADEAEKIARQVKDPFIQKYLKCLAAHICTVPVTQVVMILAGGAAVLYGMFARGMDWTHAVGLGTLVAVAIQSSPISPGSITRGIIVLYLMIRERDVKNYYIAAPISFIHVIGYLAFPLQMVAHDPALARFMAGRWATGAVRLVPVFGERGGLLEHCVFDAFFNFPLSLKRSFKHRPVLIGLWLLCMAGLIGVLGYHALIGAFLAYAKGLELIGRISHWIG